MVDLGFVRDMRGTDALDSDRRADKRVREAVAPGYRCLAAGHRRHRNPIHDLVNTVWRPIVVELSSRRSSAKRNRILSAHRTGTVPARCRHCAGKV